LTPPEELEKIPLKFCYSFQCDGTDWEMNESYRKWRNDYGNNWESKFRQRYEREMINKLDTHFYVGTIHGHPHVWITGGLFYPPMSKIDDTLRLFQ